MVLPSRRWNLKLQEMNLRSKETIHTRWSEQASLNAGNQEAKGVKLA
jgi:hypothetical protein